MGGQAGGWVALGQNQLSTLGTPRTPELLWNGRGVRPSGSEPAAGGEGGQRRGHPAQLPRHREDHTGGLESWDQAVGSPLCALYEF